MLKQMEYVSTVGMENNLYGGKKKENKPESLGYCWTVVKYAV